MNNIKTIAVFIILIWCTMSCRLTQHYSKYIIVNEYGRMEAKEMKFKKSFKKEMSLNVDYQAIYYSYSTNNLLNAEHHTIINLFENGQYAFFSERIEGINGSDYKIIDYNNYNYASKIGYYNVKDSIITIESPNHLFRRSGKRNLDKYKILPNGDLMSVTKAASDYNSVYKRIKLPEETIKRRPYW